MQLVQQQAQIAQQTASTNQKISEFNANRAKVKFREEQTGSHLVGMDDRVYDQEMERVRQQ